jgi:hypothetical protein
MGRAKQAEQEPRTPEEMELIKQRILEVQLQTAELGLARAQDDNQAYLAKKQQQKQNLAALQQAFTDIRARDAAKIRVCRHRMGGTPGNTHRGDGKPCVVRHKMPFGEWRVFCLRCPLAIMEPNPSLMATHPEQYEKVKAEYDKMFELSEESGLAPSEGPTFLATKNGVPFRPEYV